MKGLPMLPSVPPNAETHRKHRPPNLSLNLLRRCLHASGSLAMHFPVGTRRRVDGAMRDPHGQIAPPPPFRFAGVKQSQLLPGNNQSPARRTPQADEMSADEGIALVPREGSPSSGTTRTDAAADALAVPDTPADAVTLTAADPATDGAGLHHRRHAGAANGGPGVELDVADKAEGKDIVVDVPANGGPSAPLAPPVDPEAGAVPPVVDEMASNAPRLGLLELFGKFLVFGLRAWGGPVAQIAMLKEQLVIKEKWISIKKFNRVYAVYQVLPGPEAAELCCYFGMLSRGRLGALIAGLGFILPGFFLMLLLSYIYYLIGFSNVYVNASFRALQPVVAAFVLRAVHKIAEHAFHSHRTKKFSNVLFWLALASFLQSALRINFFITLGVFALLWFLWDRGNGMWAAGNKKHAYYWYAAAGVIIAADIAGYVAYVATRGFPGRNSLAIGIAPNPPDLGHLFALGLVAGVLSFGGAYTAIPFVQQEAVVLGKWLSNQVFLDGIAIGNVIPAPLVIFVTFVGFQGGLAGYNGNLGYAFAGAILMTLGMFIPCFSFTIIGHDFWEWLVMLDPIQSALEGVTASVTGLIAVVAMELLRYSVTVQLSDPRLPTAEDKLGAVNSNGVSAVLYVLTLISLYFFKAAGGKVSIILVVAAAIAGQFLYLPADA